MINISIVVLCKDNPDELKNTLMSIENQIKPCMLEVLIGDGSSDSKCLNAVSTVFKESKKLSWRHIPDEGPKGIYYAMNNCIKNATYETIAFMNSGDVYIRNDSLVLLHKTYIKANKDRNINAVFGRVMIRSQDFKINWFVPGAGVKNISLWLKCFEPNHQGMLFSTEWAKNNLFDTKSPIGADATFKKKSLSNADETAFCAVPIAEFTLGGVSSKPADFKLLTVKLTEPSRSITAKFFELIKFLLYKLIPIRYEIIMKYKSIIVSKFFC